MLITLDDMIAKYGLEVKSILHVGAHTGEEAEAYDNAGVKDVWWVEGNPELMDQLRSHVEPYGHHVIEGLVSAVDGDTVTFHISNNFQSSSIFALGTHKIVSPDVHYTHDLQLPTNKLDTLVAEHGVPPCNFLNMDLQGAELLCLQGAAGVLAHVDYIYTEINEHELYVGCARRVELDNFLRPLGFQRRAQKMAGKKEGWGDALYVRNGRNTSATAAEPRAADRRRRSNHRQGRRIPAGPPYGGSAREPAPSAPVFGAAAERDQLILADPTAFRFKIVMAAWNCPQYIERAMRSVAEQNVSNFDVCITDDASPGQEGDELRAAISEFCNKQNMTDDANAPIWDDVFAPAHMGTLYNQVAAIRAMAPEPEDVIVFVDGDDRLAHHGVLRYLTEVYADGDTLMTYGSYEPDPPSTTCNPAVRYPVETVATNDYRRQAREAGGILYNHLRTFKAGLFMQLTDADFQNKGRWLQTAPDSALMFPCMELAEGHLKMLDKVLLKYTSDNQLSDWRRHPRQVDTDHDWILSQPKKVWADR